MCHNKSVLYKNGWKIIVFSSKASPLTTWDLTYHSVKQRFTWTCSGINKGQFGPLKGCTHIFVSISVGFFPPLLPSCISFTVNKWRYARQVTVNEMTFCKTELQHKLITCDIHSDLNNEFIPVSIVSANFSSPSKGWDPSPCSSVSFWLRHSFASCILLVIKLDQYIGSEPDAAE